MRRSSLVGWSAAAWLTLLMGSCADEPALSPASTVMVEVTAEVSATTAATVPTAATPTTRPPPVEGLLFLPESFRDRMVELVEETQALRAFTFAEPLQIEGITSQEMVRRLRDGVGNDPRLSEVDQPLFRLLGLIDPTHDWVTVLSDFRARPIPGYYDVASQKLWLVTTLDDPSPLEEMTLVGEIAKALVDRHLGVWRRQSRLARVGDSDYLAVLGGMAEADATLVELLFMEGMSESAREQVLGEAWEVASADLALPSFLTRSLGFASGPVLEYLQTLFQSGGWDSVNQTHRDPPDSTELILEQGAGPADPLLLPKPDASPPEAYQLVSDSVWGQWGWNALLASALPGEQAAVASRGWGGDRYLVFSDGEGIALVVDYLGDTAADADEMRSALVEYIREAMDAGEPTVTDDGVEFSGATYAWLGGVDEALTFIAASDVEVGRGLRASRSG
ncbi:MAG: hypothetical protein OXQ32_08320 [bacterium]|nr:hypothetical protein [bacterium]